MRRFAPQSFAAACALALLCLAASAAAPVLADEAEAKTLLRHLEDEIEGIRPQLINAGARMRGGAVSMGSSTDGAPLTPARRCCEQNIVKLQRQIREMSAIWGELVACYRDEDNAEAEIQANFVREDAASMVRALSNFAQSPTEGGSVGGYQAMIRAYKQVQESSGKLVDCGEPRVRERTQ